MLRTLTAALVLIAGPAMADMITKPSPHTVTETADRMVALIEGAGAKVVARVDHSAAAGSVDLELAEATLLLFGNPKVGTPVMQEDLRAGLVLPLRVLVHAADGGSAITYQDAASLFAGMDVDLDGEAAGRINGALGMLTDKATAAE